MFLFPVPIVWLIYTWKWFYQKLRALNYANHRIASELREVRKLALQFPIFTDLQGTDDWKLKARNPINA